MIWTHPFRGAHGLKLCFSYTLSHVLQTHLSPKTYNGKRCFWSQMVATKFWRYRLVNQGFVPRFKGWTFLRWRNSPQLITRWWQLKHFFKFHPEPLGRWSNLTIIFFKWVETQRLTRSVSKLGSFFCTFRWRISEISTLVKNDHHWRLSNFVHGRSRTSWEI